MKKWFLRLLKAGLLVVGFMLASAMTIIVLSRPSPHEIALVPMSVDAGSMEAVGFVVNSTQSAWVIYVASTNEANGIVRLSRVSVTADGLQAVKYATPVLGPNDKTTFSIVYARRLAPPAN